MGIQALFNATWEQVSRGALKYANADMISEQRVVVISHCVGGTTAAQLIMMFDETGQAALITSRFCAAPLAIPAYLHTLRQYRRIRKDGIVCNVAFEKGVVTCTYSRVGWLERVARSSCAHYCAQEQPEQSPPTPSEENTGYNSLETSIL